MPASGLGCQLYPDPAETSAVLTGWAGWAESCATVERVRLSDDSVERLRDLDHSVVLTTGHFAVPRHPGRPRRCPRNTASTLAATTSSTTSSTSAGLRRCCSCTGEDRERAGTNGSSPSIPRGGEPSACFPSKGTRPGTSSAAPGVFVNGHQVTAIDTIGYTVYVAYNSGEIVALDDRVLVRDTAARESYATRAATAQ
ncbi:hypothetical protein [Amycolatopsis sp. M39]|uniref:hypothetical protein n=1 Tax=Amycolatopsis sp. M39 TaxID=1825094 RepID=UPI001E632953|nr:hypothetical protein [Amycolatopsis sp. M39]